MSTAARSSRAGPSTTASCTTPRRRRSQITAELNSGYHDPGEVRALLGRLTGRPVDDSVTLFPPFHTEFGKNLHLGKNVFINLGCRFQDTGGITIGDGTLIGHGSTLTTLNHAVDPAPPRRHDPEPDPHRTQRLARRRSHRGARRLHRRRRHRRRRLRRHQGRPSRHHRRGCARQGHPHDRIRHDSVCLTEPLLRSRQTRAVRRRPSDCEGLSHVRNHFRPGRWTHDARATHLRVLRAAGPAGKRRCTLRHR